MMARAILGVANLPASGQSAELPEKDRYLVHAAHANQGESTSRNLGIRRHAKGEYIALLDADDVWLPDKLERTTGDPKRSTGSWYGIRSQSILA